MVHAQQFASPNVPWGSIELHYILRCSTIFSFALVCKLLIYGTAQYNLVTVPQSV